MNTKYFKLLVRYMEQAYQLIKEKKKLNLGDCEKLLKIGNVNTRLVKKFIKNHGRTLTINKN